MTSMPHLAWRAASRRRARPLLRHATATRCCALHGCAGFRLTARMGIARSRGGADVDNYNVLQFSRSARRLRRPAVACIARNIREKFLLLT
jgi:hypothetical protein